KDLKLTIGNIRLGTQNATVTYDDLVKLYLDASDSSGYGTKIWGMAGSETEAGADTIFMSEHNVQLQPGDGIKYIHAQFFDPIGHVSDVVQDIIILDRNHIVYPDRDNEIYIPEAENDEIALNDTRLFIPEGAVPGKLIITPYMAKRLSANPDTLDPTKLPSISDHPRIDSQIVESIKFIVQNSETGEFISNLRFNTPVDPLKSVEFRFHYDIQSLIEADVDFDQEDDLRIFYWDGVNWVFLGGDANPDSNFVYIKNLNFLSTAPPPPGDPLNLSEYRPDYGIFKEESGFLDPLANLSVRPNPFTPNGDGVNDQVLFDFGRALDPNEKLTIKIFDERGYQVRTIRNDFYPIVWDGKDNHGSVLEGGLYFYQVDFMDQFHPGSLVLIR
ncbi:MAG: hypothetical protein GY839_17825, partial [candidate division Zixibacteria bacterium]|nr:hypothetical protein [candidate division Zixibacteria bacterium]